MWCVSGLNYSKTSKSTIIFKLLNSSSSWCMFCIFAKYLAFFNITNTLLNFFMVLAFTFHGVNFVLLMLSKNSSTYCSKASRNWKKRVPKLTTSMFKNQQTEIRRSHWDRCACYRNRFVRFARFLLDFVCTIPWILFSVYLGWKFGS